MPKVIVRDGETLKSALQRLRKSVNLAHRRQFYKGRVGCYEKPSDKRRRAKRAGRRRSRLRERYGDGDFTVYMSLRLYTLAEKIRSAGGPERFFRGGAAARSYVYIVCSLKDSCRSATLIANNQATLKHQLWFPPSIRRNSPNDYCERNPGRCPNTPVRRTSAADPCPLGYSIRQ